ncbi:MAG: aminotransferase class [Acidimicrobiales bacterium]|nr:aminotransferase class [Acidimicrobiales bacterium]
MPTHAELLARHRRVLPGWLALAYDEPISLVDGHGCEVVDAEGHRYLDFFGGILTTMTGHGVPEVVEAIREQAGKIVHTSTLYLIEPMIELAERLAELSTIPGAKVFFTTSGTEANEAALLLAMNARRSNQLLALRNSYHGRSFATMAATGNRGWRASSLTPLVVHYVQNGDRFRGPHRGLDDVAFIAAVAHDVRDVLATCTGGDVGAFIAEPIQGVGGCIVPPDGMFGAVQDVLREHGILYISDEVQTGWGRTGEHFWGFQAHDVEPDLITFAKGLGNGLPIAGVIGRGDLMDSITTSSISTFGGNPLVSAGALANLRVLLDQDLQGNARAQGARMLAALRPLATRLAVVGDVRGRGLMIGIELVGPDGIAPAPDAAAAVMEECRANGLLVGRGGLHASCLRIAPPLSLSAAEADRGVGILTAAIESVEHAPAHAG